MEYTEASNFQNIKYNYCKLNCFKTVLSSFSSKFFISNQLIPVQVILFPQDLESTPSPLPAYMLL